MTVLYEAARGDAVRGTRRARNAREIQRSSFHFSDIWRAPLNDFPIRDEILYQCLPLSADMDILEIGPGSGFTAFRLARRVRSLTLVDVAAQSLAKVSEQLRSLANVRCVSADPTRPGLSTELNQEFDAVFALDVFEYVVDPLTCLRNVAQSLRASGELFLTYPNIPPPAGDGVTYFPCVFDLQDLLGRAGFRRWQILAVRQRPFARRLHLVAHEYPLRVFRRLRRGNPRGRPQTYDASWAFKHEDRLKRYKMPLHVFWFLLAHALRLGGDVFATEPVSDGIVGRQLVIRAWK